MGGQRRCNSPEGRTLALPALASLARHCVRPEERLPDLEPRLPLAIYHASVRTMGRSAGRSATAAAAYRSGTAIVDERTGEVHDYTRRRGVEHAELVGWVGERAELWNAAEAAERRMDARVARELVIALPAELSQSERVDAARKMAEHLRERYGVAVDLAVHAPSERGDQRNHHAHLLFTTRVVDENSLSAKTRMLDVPRSAREEIRQIREAWAGIANHALVRAGAAVRIDPRSLEAQGVDREATQHMGPRATEMERRGVRSRIGEDNRRRIEIAGIEIYREGGEGGEEGRTGVQRTNPSKEDHMGEIVSERTGTGDAKARGAAWQEPMERSAGSAARGEPPARSPTDVSAKRATPGLDLEAIKKEFASARSWKDLEARLEAQGARIAPRENGRGVGLAVTNGEQEAPLHQLSQKAAELNERFGQTYTRYRASQTVEPRREEAQGRDRGSGAPLSAAPEGAARTSGAEAQATGKETVERRSPKLDPAVRELVEELKIYEQARNADRHVRQAVVEAGSAQQEVHALRDAISRAEVRRSEFNRALERTYKNPGVAREVFVQAAAEHGAERAQELMRSKPELFGELAEQRRLMGMVRETRTARDAARGAAAAGKEYLEVRSAAPSAERMKAAEQRLEVANRQVRELVAENKLPPVQSLERSIGRRAAALTPVQQAQLQRAIPAPSLGTVMTAARLVREQGNVMER